MHPKPFDPATIDPENVSVSYDRQSDTLIIALFGSDLATISVPVGKYLYLMVTPDTETIVGFHVEGFLRAAVKDEPSSIELLDYAELRGITPTEVWALQRQILGEAGLSRNMIERRKAAVASFIDAERSRFELHCVPTLT
jgi:hypothetical protein